jgi:TRAP-type C4-dicarboxylate transport system permease small subunit
MSDPRISALICSAVAAWLAYSIFSPGEAPSPIVSIMQWVFFVCAVAGVIAAVVRIVRERG